jgi:HD-GYP domain-containing protein (c-di-GMP phosphodiesterase class II)
VLMLSFKRIIHTLKLFIIVIIIITFSFNIFLVTNIKGDLFHMEEDIRLLQEQILSLDLPIKVIDNIANQLQSSSDIIVLNENMKVAYIRNHRLSLSILLEIIDKLEHLTTYSENSQLMLFQNYRVHLDENLRLSMQALKVSATLSRLLTYSESTSDFEYLKTLNSQELIAFTLQLTVLINGLVDEVNLLGIEVIESSLINLNIIYAVLIVLLIIMLMLISRLLNSNLYYSLSSIRQLSHNDYNLDTLPKHHNLFSEEVQMTQFITQVFDEYKLTADIKNLVMNTYDMDTLFQELFDILQKTFHIDRLGICFVDYSRELLVAETGVASYDPILLSSGFSVSIKGTSLNQVLESKKGVTTNDLETLHIAKPDSPSLKLVRQEGLLSNMNIPLIINDAVFGIVFLSSLEKDHFKEDDLSLATKIISEITGFLNRSYLLKVVFNKFSLSFSELVNERDYETGDHLLRMTKYSVILATALKAKNLQDYPITKSDILEISRYAPLHDIGKVAVPDNILKKPGQLDADEWVIMKSHVNVGQQIFRDIRKELKFFDESFFKVAEDIIACHHEKWDGSGYPNGLMGMDIPLPGRIIALADVFDALTSKRVYKKAFTLEEATTIIKDSRGNHFDPVLVDILFEEFDKFYEIFTNRS